MKFFSKKCMLMLLVAVFVSQSFAQEIPDSTYYKRLFYFCKVWGYAKYHHTEIANGNVNWDYELRDIVNGIKIAPTNEAFNDTLQRMLNNAGEMGISNAVLPDVPDSLNNDLDLSWMQNPIFSDTVRALLDTIRARFRPQDNVYVGKYFTDGNPNFENDKLYHGWPDYPDEKFRVMALFRYWNIIHYFFPYKYMMDQDWNKTLVEFIPKIIESTDIQSYQLNFKEFTTRINDSQGFFSSYFYRYWKGIYYPPFYVRNIENEMVITKVKSGITEVKVGDIVKGMDGIEISILRDSVRRYAHGSNNVSIEKNINEILMWGDIGEFQVTVDDGINIQTKTLSRDATNFLDIYYDFRNPVWRDTIINDTCSYGIVDMVQLDPSDVGNMFDDLWDAETIIFDQRNNPNGTLWEIVNYIYPQSLLIANFTILDIKYPGRLYWREHYIGFGTTNPYSGNIIILFDERTQKNRAEFTVMGLEQFPGAIKMGSTTAAADGNISIIYVPGRIQTYMTGLGTFYPDYTATQRVGIVPDYEVRPTILGIRAGRDEVLEAALNCASLGVEEKVKAEEVKLYPNPVGNTMNYELSSFENGDIVVLEIIDVFGRTLKTVESKTKQGEINFSAAKKGIYFVKITRGNKTLAKKIIKH